MLLIVTDPLNAMSIGFEDYLDGTADGYWCLSQTQVLCHCRRWKEGNEKTQNKASHHFHLKSLQ
jgi:hypothetical protein